MIRISEYYLSLLSFSVVEPSTHLHIYSVHLARRTGCLSFVPWEMMGMHDEENGRRDKMHL